MFNLLQNNVLLYDFIISQRIEDYFCLLDWYINGIYVITHIYDTCIGNKPTKKDFMTY